MNLFTSAYVNLALQVNNIQHSSYFYHVEIILWTL